MGSPMLLKEPPKFMSVTKTDDGAACVDLRGVFPCDPMEISEEIKQLRALSGSCSMVRVHIRSPGGSGDTMTEILSVLRMFEYVHTFGYGSICSAGAIIWACGNVRVLAEYTEVMFHRESFGLPYGKVPEHRSQIEFVERLYGQLLEDTSGDILTPEEMEQAKNGEVYLTSQELYDRGACIDMLRYDERMGARMTTSGVIDIDGVPFLATGGTMRRILEMKVEATEFLLGHDLFWLEASDFEEEEEEEEENSDNSSEIDLSLLDGEEESSEDIVISSDEEKTVEDQVVSDVVILTEESETKSE